MKLAFAICLSLLAGSLAACTSTGASHSAILPDGASPLLGDAAGKMKLTGFYPIPFMGDVDAAGIVSGPHRSLWFTMFEANDIASITTAGVQNYFPTASNAQPNGIALGASRQRVWSGGYGGNLRKQNRRI